MMRLFSYFLGIVFTLFAVVQFNDPDYIIWICLYLIPAAVALTFTHRKPNKWLLLILAISFLIGSVELFPPSIKDWISAEEEAQSLGMKLPGIEEARESLGLFICFIAMTFFWFKAKQK